MIVVLGQVSNVSAKPWREQVRFQYDDDDDDDDDNDVLFILSKLVGFYSTTNSSLK